MDTHDPSPPMRRTLRLALGMALAAAAGCLAAALLLSVIVLTSSATPLPWWTTMKAVAAIAAGTSTAAALVWWAATRSQAEPQPAPALPEAADPFAPTAPMTHEHQSPWLDGARSADTTAHPGDNDPARTPASGWHGMFEPTLPNPDIAGPERALAALTGARGELTELASNAADLAALTINSVRCTEEIQGVLIHARQRVGTLTGLAASTAAHHGACTEAVRQLKQQWHSGGVPAGAHTATGSTAPGLVGLADAAAAALQQGERDMAAQTLALRALAGSLADMADDLAKLQRMLRLQAQCGRGASNSAAAALTDMDRVRAALDG